ncbi:MAG: arsenite S-adenosylmethyltransferase, partial [Chloroflexi bacterium]|nr:arsenite S-adenosylmethyltransferase [Chloroflexota bacterium]
GTVQQSIAAYIGCLAGAALKEQYLAAVKQAGFKDVKIIEESSFETDYIVKDPTVQAILKDEKVSRDDLKKLGKAVRSIKVSASKPV